MKDLPKNLRDTAEFFDSFPTGVHPQRTLWIRQGADEIERLRAALSGIVEAWDECTRGKPPSDYDQSPNFLARRAQAALSNN